MKKKTLVSEIVLLVATIIWGSAFLFQKQGSTQLDALTFTSFRNIAGALFLILLSIVVLLFRKKKGMPSLNQSKKSLWLGGILIGIVTAGAMYTQQMGVSLESTGKSGFLTAIYIVFVPLIGLIFKKKTHPIILVSLLFAGVGLYLVNYDGSGFRFSIGTAYLLGCALLYALQICLIEVFSPKCDPIHLSTVQFSTTAIILTIALLIRGNIEWTAIPSAMPSLLYTGIFSTGIGFTLQIFAQANIPAAPASVIMSLESVFAIIFAAIFLKETYSWIQLLGCASIFLGVLIAQLPSLYSKKGKDEKVTS